MILDSSPVLPVTDAVMLAARVDAPVVGTVLNRDPDASSYG